MLASCYCKVQTYYSHALNFILLCCCQISQYFGKNPKKRDLSDSSKTGDDDSKKSREGSSGSYTDEVDIFEEGVESADGRKVFINCLKNLEQKINDLYMLANSNKGMHIKGPKQLINLTSSVKFLTTKFDELKKARQEKGELINSLQIVVS